MCAVGFYVCIIPARGFASLSEKGGKGVESEREKKR
jgi:hypothetical protein